MKLFIIPLLVLIAAPPHAQTATVPTTFTPLVKGFSWTLSTLNVAQAPLPAGETESGVTIGIRMVGDATHSAGNYQWLYVAPAGATTATLAQIQAQLGFTLAEATNYYAALDQTDMLNGSPSTSPWTAEIGFSIPIAVVQPCPPLAFAAN